MVFSYRPMNPDVDFSSYLTLLSMCPQKSIISLFLKSLVYTPTMFAELYLH